MNNTIELIKLWDKQDGFKINGTIFTIFHETIFTGLKSNGYEEYKENRYTIYIAYDFNKSNKVVVTAKGLKSLQNKLEKIDYLIVKPD